MSEKVSVEKLNLFAGTYVRGRKNGNELDALGESPIIGKTAVPKPEEYPAGNPWEVKPGKDAGSPVRQKSREAANRLREENEQLRNTSAVSTRLNKVWLGRILLVALVLIIALAAPVAAIRFDDDAMVANSTAGKLERLIADNRASSVAMMQGFVNIDSAECVADYAEHVLHMKKAEDSEITVIKKAEPQDSLSAENHGLVYGEEPGFFEKLLRIFK